MIRSLYRTQEGQTHTDLGLDEIAAALRDARGLLWVDFVEESPEVCEPILREIFGFHPLAVADALQESHVPKVDDWGQYLYLVLHAVVYNRQNDGHLGTLELDAFLGKNYIVTHQEQAIGAVSRVWSAHQRDERYLKRGPDHLLYRLAGELVAEYMPVVEELDRHLERIEDEIFARPTPATLEQILMLKRALLHLARTITPQREVLHKLAREDYTVIDAKDRVFFGDIYDHLVRLHDINESVLELASGAVDTYLSITDHRMNEVMRTLTIIATLFMPATFIAGFFGMNFFQADTPLTAWTSTWGFLAMMATMLLTPVGMFVWIRRRTGL